MNNDDDFAAALRASHRDRSAGMGSFSVPAWCQFIALACFACRAKSIRAGMLAGLILMAGAALYAYLNGGAEVLEDGPVLPAFSVGLTLLFLPLIKAGELKLKLSALGVLDEFMAQLFADQPAAIWLRRKFGK